MPDLPKRIRLYKELIEFILKEHEDIINIDRLSMFLTKAGRRHPLIKNIEIGEDGILVLPEDISDDEEFGLKNLSAVIGCAYKVLEMFLGSGTARDRIVESVDKFRGLHPEIDGLNLARYLPKREEPTEAGEGEEGDTLPDGGTSGIEDLTDGEEEVTAEDILSPKEEGIPHYDEEKKEWVLMPPHVVKKVKEEMTSDIEPVFEDVALKRKRMYKKTVKKGKTEKAVEEKPRTPVDLGDPYRWLQEEFFSKATYFVEGTGQEKNMLCAEFVKEGLDAGEDIIVILGYPPKIFYNQMQRIGALESDLMDIHVIDWHTFKEKHVVDIETEGNVHVVPKDPKFMGSVLTKILGALDKDKRKRAFVSIVSYALAFIDFETIYNFVQITRLKFRKANIAAMFTIEAGQHEKDIRNSFRDITDGWIRIREGMSGANTWKMRAEIVDFNSSRKANKDIVIMKDGIVVLDRKGMGKEEDEPVPEALKKETVTDDAKASAALKKKMELDQYLVEKIEMWKGLGFNVDVLEGAKKEGERPFKKAVIVFEKKANKALETRGRLDEVAIKLDKLRDQKLDNEVLELRRMLRDLEDLEDVDKRISALENRLERKLEMEGRKREREKEIFRIRLEHWARQGYDTSELEGIMHKDLETVNKEFARFRSIVNRLKRIEEDLNKMETRGHEEEVKAIRDRLFNVLGVERTEEMFNNLRQEVMVKERIKETAKTRRNELMDEIFNWALEGYCVDLIDQIDIFKEDLGSLEARLGQLRKRIERLKRMEDILNSLDLSRHAKEEREIRDIIKDVDMVDEVETRVMGLQEIIKGKIPGDVMAIDANIERVKDLEETWQKLKARLLAESKRKGRAPEEEKGG